MAVIRGGQGGSGRTRERLLPSQLHRRVVRAGKGPTESHPPRRLRQVSWRTALRDLRCVLRSQVAHKAGKPVPACYTFGDPVIRGADDISPEETFHQVQYEIQKIQFDENHWHLYAAPEGRDLITLMNEMWDGYAAGVKT